MGMSLGILAPFIAFVITIAAMQAAVVLTGAIRERDYSYFEDASKESIARQFPLPAVDASTAEARRKSLSPFLDKSHKHASVAQTKYYNAVVRSAGCLVLAFLSLAFGTLRPEDWPAWLDWPFLELVLNWIDVIAILFVLILFLYGRRACRPWIAGRAGAELIRQYQFLSLVFPSAISLRPDDDLKTTFDIEVGLIAASVQNGSLTDIATRIERFWSTRRASIESRSLTDADLTADGLVVYLERRARRQLGWFADSKGRLEHIAERRNIVLLSLYYITAGLAVIRHVLFLRGEHSQAYLEPLLLIATGMSAAMTAHYINLNSRSLIHRYSAQQRFITSWLATFNKRWKFVNLPSLNIDNPAKNDMRAQILRFEDLMIEELIDWIHITSHDAIELAP
jgi:hypothetical protein